MPTYLTARDARQLVPGTVVYCTVTALRNRAYVVERVRPRDGYLFLRGERRACPPSNFRTTPAVWSDTHGGWVSPCGPPADHSGPQR